jgi:hypothetical protein
MDPATHGSMFIPVILGTDKTTVSVATGQHEYHPVYLSVGNIHNHFRRAHKDALVLIGFLPIPKGNHLLIPTYSTSLTTYRRSGRYEG